MATVYVSQSTANGWAVGNDSNSYAQAQHTTAGLPDTPWLTIAHAVASCSNTDTIIVNDGTYAENSGSNYLAPTHTGLTIQAQNAGLVTLQAFNSGAARCLHVPNTGQGLTCTNLVFDGQSHQAQCVTTDSTNQLTALTFTGCSFKNYNTNGLTIGDVAAYSHTGGTITHTPTASTAYGISISGTAAHSATDNYTVSGVSILTSGAGPSITTLGGINVFWPTAAGGTAILTNNTIALISNGASGTLVGILINGGPSYTITSNTINLTAPNYTASNVIEGIRAQMSGTAISAALNIGTNIISLPKGHTGSFGGYGILIGNDVTSAPTTPNAYTAPTIYNNTISGGFWGVELNFVTSAVVYGNIVENCVIALASRQATTCTFHDNSVMALDGTNAALYARGDNGGAWLRNTVYLDLTDATSTFIRVLTDASTASSGSTFTANALCSAATVTHAVTVDAGNMATFGTGNYSARSGFGAAAFSYQGTVYATLALWIAAKEHDATQIACYVVPPLITVYVSQATSNGFAAGSDSNTYLQAQNKATPWLTIDHAVRNATPGDAIVVNDGTYTENTASLGYLQVNNGPYALSAFNAGSVTLRASSSGSSRCLHVNQGGQGLVCTGILFDGQANQAQCVTTDSSHQLSGLTFSACTFQNYTTSALVLQDCALALVTGCTMVHMPSATNAFAVVLTGSTTNAATNNYTITGCTIHTTGGGTNKSFVAALNVDWPQASGGTVTLSANTITLATSLSSGSLYGIYIETPGPTYVISGNAITLSGGSITSSNALSGIEVNYINFPPTISPSVAIVGNTISGPKGTSTAYAGHGIAVGNDTETAPQQANCYQNVVIALNRLNGVNHGILCNWVTGAQVYGNSIKNCFLGIVSKFVTTCTYRENIVSLLDSSNTSKALYGKGDTGSTFALNVVILDNTCNAAAFLYAGEGSVVLQGSSGTIFSNNVLYATAQVTDAVTVDSVSTATFIANNYYSTVSFGATAFQYRGVVCATFGAWRDAFEASATNLATPPQYAMVDDLLLHGAEANDENLSSHAALLPASAWSVFTAENAAPDVRLNAQGVYDHGAAPQVGAYIAPGTPPSASYDVVYDVNVLSVVDQSTAGALVRIPSGPTDNYYQAALQLLSAGSQWAISKTGGTATLGTPGGTGAQALLTLPAIFRVRVQVRPTWLALQVTSPATGATWSLTQWRLDSDLAAAGSVGAKWTNATVTGSSSTGAQLWHMDVRRPVDLTLSQPIVTINAPTPATIVATASGAPLVPYTGVASPFVVTGGTGAVISEQLVVNGNTVSLVLAPGSGSPQAAGTLWLTDTVNGISAPLALAVSIQPTAPSPNTATASGGAGTLTYLAGEGDTLPAIAALFYQRSGYGNFYQLVQDIMALNPGIVDWTLDLAGLTILIPTTANASPV